MGLIKFRKGRELEVGIEFEAPREFGFGVGRLERDEGFVIAYRTKETSNCGCLLLSTQL
jgi:hypothetical protein